MSKPTISERDKIYLWIRKNRGVCSRVARDLDLSHSFVRDVIYGHAKSAELRVEKALIESGAAFISDRLNEAA